jgi:pimeloyl-ACP methyl ester carboxylesterase
MSHGLVIGSVASWYFTCAPQLAKLRRVRVWDLRGHGKSDLVPTGYDVQTMAGDLASVLPEGPVDLVGQSWGALVSLRYAIDHPDRVRRLALVEAPLPPSNVSEMAAFVSGGDALLALPEQMRPTGRRLKALARLMLETSLIDDLRAERDFSDDELARVTCPMLAVYGDRSSCAPAGARLARAGAKHRVLHGGHLLHLDAKDELAELLAKFLDEQIEDR